MSDTDYLTDNEIGTFFVEIDTDEDNNVSYAELEAKLDEVNKEIAPDPKPHHLHHMDREDEERHNFLRSIMKVDKDHLTREEFFETVRSWNIPSQARESTKDSEKKDREYEEHLPLGRRIRAHWSVDGPPYVFMAFLVSLMLIFGLWQLITYIKDYDKRRALGWGVIVAKGSAGVLYPTLFFMILSMSRHLATFARYNYWIARFVNFDRSQSFHIKISIFALAMASLHAIGHLTGTFLYSSRPGRKATVEAVVGQSRTYRQYVATLPGVTGISALGIFYLMALLSMPQVRKRSYEIFQASHLLMFPFIGLLMAHGTWAILQPPMLGYWLAFPTLIVLGERLHRLYRSFIKVPAEFEILDDETIAIICAHPKGKPWRYEAGQYVLLQVPQIAFFQWHPFTISTCTDNLMTLHIKTDGDWTSKLRNSNFSYVGIDGPFGAPAQRFYDFEKSIIIGAGIGVTPFSGILNDLEQRTKLGSSRTPSRSRSRIPSYVDTHSHLNTSFEKYDPSSSPSTQPLSNAEQAERGRTLSRSTNTNDHHHSEKSPDDTKPASSTLPRYRCDFHWMVRDKNYYLWFSDLLNRISAYPKHNNLQVNITTHLTATRKNLSTIIFRYLLENHRTAQHPASSLTGLVNKTHFGRPDFPQILLEHYEEMKSAGYTGKVGVFYCGSPVVGYIISDQCDYLTARARADGNYMRYVFMIEVFG